jgi:hypothetical protein
MAEINPRTAQHDSQLEAVLDSMLVDITAAKAAIDAMATKLNADGGVTDTNYAAAAALTTTT